MGLFEMMDRIRISDHSRHGGRTTHEGRVARRTPGSPTARPFFCLCVRLRRALASSPSEPPRPFCPLIRFPPFHDRSPLRCPGDIHAPGWKVPPVDTDVCRIFQTIRRGRAGRRLGRHPIAYSRGPVLGCGRLGDSGEGTGRSPAESLGRSEDEREDVRREFGPSHPSHPSYRKDGRVWQTRRQWIRTAKRRV